MIALQRFIPAEFVRKPRSLNELRRFKATEFRQFLFYTGPIVLKPILDEDSYLHFIVLHAACTILCNKQNLKSYQTYAKSLLKYFVESFGTLYGIQYMSHNIYNLLHICDDTTSFRILDNFSAFPFENYLSSVKKTRSQRG